MATKPAPLGKNKAKPAPSKAKQKPKMVNGKKGLMTKTAMSKIKGAC